MIVKKGEIGFELDMTNMYGKAMRMALPYRVLSKEESKNYDINEMLNWLTDSNKQFSKKYVYDTLDKEDLKHCGFVRVNLSFTKEQQDRLWKFPVLPIRRVVDDF